MSVRWLLIVVLMFRIKCDRLATKEDPPPVGDDEKCTSCRTLDIGCKAVLTAILLSGARLMRSGTYVYRPKKRGPQPGCVSGREGA